MKDQSERVIFRRYRRGKNGEILDARKYGLKAWPIKVCGDKKQG
jgi:hypothetical protein